MGQKIDSRKEIAIFTPYFLGSVNSSGIATACHSLAECLVDAGHSVSVVLAHRAFKGHRFEYWQNVYRKKGIRLVTLPVPELRIEAPTPAERSYAVYLYLREHHFDIVHFPELLGLGYYSVLAKKLRLGFERTTFCVTVNGPSIWHRLGNHEVGHFEDIACDFLERRSTELADAVFAPSQHILDWVREREWSLPKATRVVQYALPTAARPAYRGSRTRFKEIVFFGRIETRKGIELFLDALDLLPAGILRGKKITFMGSPGAVGEIHATKYLSRRLSSPRYNWRTVFEYDQSQSLEYLRSHDVLVVTPSLSESLGFTTMECVASGIPVIASRIPAYEELIAQPDQDRMFFELTAESLATKLKGALERGWKFKPHFAVSPRITAKTWQRWHVSPASRPRPLNPPRNSPLPRISVCISHRNRPELLDQCLRSLRAQEVAPYEVILADDASDTDEAKKYLSTLRRNEKFLNLRVLRSSRRSGPVAVRNAAARLARGDYLLFMDDDDFARPDELAVFSRVAQSTGADILTCGFDRFEGEAPPGPRTPVFSRWMPMGDALAYGYFDNVFGAMNALIRRRTFQELGGLRWAQGAGHEDGEFFARAVIQGYRLLCIPEALFWCRLHQKNLTSSLDPHLGDLHRMSAYRGISRHPDIQTLLDSAMRRPQRISWSKRFRRQAHLTLRSDSRLIDHRPHYPRSIYRASAPSDFRKWKSSPDIRVVKDPGGLKVEFLSEPTGELILPCIRIPKGEGILIVVELTAFHEGQIEFSCDVIGESGKKETLTNGSRYLVGHRTLQILMQARRFLGPIRCQPSKTRQTVFFRRLEIFTEA